MARLDLEHLDAPPSEMSPEIPDEWRDYLSSFHRDLYPIFRRYGFRFAEAVLAERLNAVYQELALPVEDDGDRCDEVS